MNDLRFALRMLAKKPAFTFVAIVTLALGIGANAAIFSVVNAVMIRPLPFPDHERLAILWEINPKFTEGEVTVTAADFLHWRDHNQSFENLSAIRNRSFDLTGMGEPEKLSGASVTSNFFSMLGVAPALGRTFTDEDEKSGQVCLINHGLWQRRFGSDRETLGKEFVLNGRPYTIVGVLPEEFQLPTTQAQVWMPIALTAEDAKNRGAHMFTVMGRLRRGISINEAQTEINVLMAALAEQNPKSNADWTASVVPLREQGVTGSRTALLILLGAVGFLLAVACANVANLLLARAAGRDREFAVRAALGAGRLQLARQLFTESLLLTLMGGASGLLLAMWTVDFFVSLAPKEIPRLRDAHLDLRVIGFTLLLSILTAVLSGLAPAFRSMKVDLNESLKEGGRGISKGFRHLGAIMAVETGLALVLLISAGLLIRSYTQLLRIDPGIRPENVLTMTFSLPPSAYREDAKRIDFINDVTDRVSSLPGVRSAAITDNLPLSGNTGFYFITVEGQPPLREGEPMLQAESHVITPDYFRALGTPLLKGRDFNEQDRMNAPGVIIINESMARRYFGDADPIGKKAGLLMGNEKPRVIVGVAGDVRRKGLDREAPDQIYLPYQQLPPYFGVLVARTDEDPLNFVASVKEQIWAVDGRLPLYDISTMERRMAQSVAGQRFSALIMGVFAALAMLLASIGVYGVMSYSVNQSVREIGIRMALGAERRHIIRMIVGKGMGLAIIGVAAGLIAALALTRFLETLLFGIAPTDAATFAGVSLMLVLVALLACYIPARRATRVDPIIALRYE